MAPVMFRCRRISISWMHLSVKFYRGVVKLFRDQRTHYFYTFRMPSEYVIFSVLKFVHSADRTYAPCFVGRIRILPLLPSMKC